MLIHISNNQKVIKLSKPQIKKIVAAVIAFEDQKCEEVSVHFVTVSKICDLHQQFFDDPSKTDCISLPMDDQSEIHYRILGEIFVCPETAIEYANSHNSNAYDEITLYIIHGLLHLLGYDDIKTKDRALMRAAEKRHVAHLKELEIYLNV